MSIEDRGIDGTLEDLRNDIMPTVVDTEVFQQIVQNVRTCFGLAGLEMNEDVLRGMCVMWAVHNTWNDQDLTTKISYSIMGLTPSVLNLMSLAAGVYVHDSGNHDETVTDDELRTLLGDE